jgi:CCR4-NOT transcriptional regulation complex NOT5 subunit
MWQENLEAMLIEDNEDTNDEISPEDIEEIENDASIYLDTSKGDLYD